MKALAFALTAVLFLPPLASSECVEVAPLYRPSTQNARITILFEGKPYGKVKLRVYTFDGHLRLSLPGDSNGIIRLPDLPAGKYCLTANAAPNLGASMCLDLSVRDRHLPNTFSMNLGSLHGVSTNLDYILDTAREQQPTKRLQSFVGVVRDPSGASIPQAVVFVLLREAQDVANPLKITADRDGHFSTRLDPGIYAAVFQFPGFGSEVVVLEITPKGSKEDLEIVLQVGHC